MRPMGQRGLCFFGRVDGWTNDLGKMTFCGAVISVCPAQLSLMRRPDVRFFPEFDSDVRCSLHATT